MMRRVCLLILLILSVGIVVAEAPAWDVIIVRDDLPVDWIIAQAYSQKANIPIVTTSPDVLDENAKLQLKGYKKAGWNKALIFGGEIAISPKIEQELTEMDFITHRISEVDRYGTSAQVANELYVTSDVGILASGDDYDAQLIAVRMATETGYPLLLIKSDKIPESVTDAMKKLKIKKVILVSNGVKPNVVSSLTVEYPDLMIVENDIDIDKFKPFKPTMPMYLLSGVLLGILLVFVAYKYQKAKNKVTLKILTEDEERVVKIILENDGEITQDLLPEKTNFSRPKVSRIVSVLVERDLILKTPYKKTHTLKIKKGVVKPG